MLHWRDLSSDPNDPKVMEYRRAVVSKTCTIRLIVDRVTYLGDLVAGRSVLDIGVVEHTREAGKSREWLHGHLKDRQRRASA